MKLRLSIHLLLMSILLVSPLLADGEGQAQSGNHSSIQPSDGYAGSRWGSSPSGSTKVWEEDEIDPLWCSFRCLYVPKFTELPQPTELYPDLTWRCEREDGPQKCRYYCQNRLFCVTVYLTRSALASEFKRKLIAKYGPGDSTPLPHWNDLPVPKFDTANGPVATPRQAENFTYWKIGGNRFLFDESTSSEGETQDLFIAFSDRFAREAGKAYINFVTAGANQAAQDAQEQKEKTTKESEGLVP